MPPVTRALSATDKFTQKWPRPRSLRHIPPSLRASHRDAPLGRVGGWSESQMKAALKDGRGLGTDWAGKWTPHKWCLLISVTVVFMTGLVSLICAVLTWFAAYPAAPLLLITDSPSFVLLTFSSSLLLLASIAGITGTLLNSRPILAVYVLLLFPSFISFVSIGYLTYKKANFALDGKMSEAWNAWYSPGARTVLQGALGCCGWASPLHGAASSGTCYTRTPLPGCRGPLLSFERNVLPTIYGAVFALVPLHIANIFVGLLCANHVTHRFGKGIMPKRYRLNAADLTRIAGSSAKQETTFASLCSSVDVVLPELARTTSSGLSVLREDRQHS
ncbi:hypothetical protein FA95DRAFT_1622805 [Auriscalpium vulgare]|uniref:Uncharacterized protein n=1 Tax=Auriscalpium vulgare TaxID=40419 RepID=A0ACB8RKX2_9AGAM|nr:hypothetical protein FA95DRAFT_1622805 [Auriscalpium vulgare]